MDLRQITEKYYVAPQIEPDELQAIAEAGIAVVICNRPDQEVPLALQAEAMRKSAEEAGLEFHVLPLTHQTFTPENISRQREIAEKAGGKVLAYCASGTRSTIAWAFGQAGKMPVDEIIAKAREGGYDLSHLRQALDTAAASD